MGRNAGAGIAPATAGVGVITPSPQNPITGIFGTGRVLFFTASENWTPPPGVTSCRVRIWGIGGNCSAGYQYAYAGGGAGFSLKVCAVTPGTSVPLTIPVASAGTTSFGAYCSATAGGDATSTGPGAAGTGIGGDINRSGGAGSPENAGAGGGAGNLLGNGGMGGRPGTSGGGALGSSSSTTPGHSGFSGPDGSAMTTIPLDFIGTGPGGPSGNNSGLPPRTGFNGGGGGGPFINGNSLINGGGGGFPGGGVGGGVPDNLKRGGALIVVEY